jgi:4-amino-4-deoxy-L-arabinose transferase-like glycosyltransferase
VTAAPPYGRREDVRARRLDFALGALLLLFCFTGVFDHGLWTTNDTRGAAMALDMERHGTWVIPTINGEAYLEKPPLMYWAVLILARLFGGVTEGVARLPSALAGFATLLLMRRFTMDRLTGWAAAFLCATSITFLEYSRAVMTDMTLAFCVMLALYVFWRTDERPVKEPLHWLPFLAVSAVSFYAKALVGPALIWCAVAAYLLWTRRPAQLAGLAAGFVPVFLLIVLPWLSALVRFGGYEALRYMFWTNQAGRFLDLRTPTMPTNPMTAHKEPIWYYLVHLPEAIGVSATLVAAALIAWFRKGSAFRGRQAVFLRCSAVGMFVLLHVSTARVAVYALPLFPVLFLMTGAWLADFARQEKQGVAERALVWISGLAWLLLVAGVPAACAAAALARPELFPSAEGLGPGRFLTGGAFCLAAMCLGAFVLLRQVRRGPRRLVLPLLPAAGALALFLDYQLIAPILERHKSYVPFARFAEAESRGGELAIGTVEYNTIGAFTFYLDRRLPVLPGPAEIAAYLSADRPRAVIVARRDLTKWVRALSSVPHEERSLEDAGARSHDFVLLTNRPPDESRSTRGSPS